MPEIRRQATLTPAQQRILEFIGAEIGWTGRPPSVREIGAAMGIGSTNGVVAHLKALERKGRIRRGKLTSRGIEIIGRNDELLSVLRHCLACAKFACEPQLAKRIEQQIAHLTKSHA